MSPPQYITRVEDIMTPRSLLMCRSEKDLVGAQQVASDYKFDAVPLLFEGTIRRYWSHKEKRILTVTKRHRVPHDSSIEQILPKLISHIVQFVCYRSEIVGLVDISDLNKPLARLTWLHPILQCEQAMIASLRSQCSDHEIERTLGDAFAGAKKRQLKAEREDLRLHYLHFAHFPPILKSANILCSLGLTVEETRELVNFRNRLAHGGRDLIERHDDGGKLQTVIATCRKILKNPRFDYLGGGSLI